MATSLFNVRVDDELEDAIIRCAAEMGVKKSVWAREVLGAVALGGVTMEQLTLLVASNGEQAQSPHPERFLTLQAQTARREHLSRSCSHPLPARKQMPFTVVCSLCGDVVKRT
jgi:hypothetical protein